MVAVSHVTTILGDSDSRPQREREREQEHVRTRRGDTKTDRQEHIWSSGGLLKRNTNSSSVDRRHWRRQGAICKRSTFPDTTAFFTDKDPASELTIYHESLFNVKMEEMGTAKAAAECWQHSWTAGDRARQPSCPQVFFLKKQQQEVEQKKNSDDGINCGSSATSTDPSTHRQLERQMQDPSADEGPTKRGSGCPLRRNKIQTSGQLQATHITHNNTKDDGIHLACDNGQGQVRILPDSFRERQPSATRTIQHLDGSTKKSGTSHSSPHTWT